MTADRDPDFEAFLRRIEPRPGQDADDYKTRTGSAQSTKLVAISMILVGVSQLLAALARLLT